MPDHSSSSAVESLASELHVIVPGLCGPLAETQSLENNPVLKKWISTLSKASCTVSVENMQNVLVSLFKLKTETEADFPSAALTLLANDMYDASMYCIHADPVYLRADMDHAVLTSSEDLHIIDTESEALCAALNQHFDQDGLRFILLKNNQWFVLTNEPINIHTTPLVDAVGRNVNFILPEGEHSTRWKQLLTEMQMLMFAHEVNTARENNAQMSINSLWFHGSGVLPELKKQDENKINSVCSNQDILKGLARLTQCNYLTVPDTANEYLSHLLSSKKTTTNVLHLSELEHLVNYTDVNLWLGKLTELLTHWIYPLIKMTNENNIKLILYPCNNKQYRFSKYDSLKFWKQGKLQQHVNSY